MMEENLRRALLLSRGDPTVFFTRPLSAAMLSIAAVLLLIIVAPNDPQEARGSVPGRLTPRPSLIRFDWSQPYPSRRQPVLARNAVATSQPLAVQAGLAMLHRGGNAVDAALATAIALTVVEPVSNGVGSDLFAIVWDGRELCRPQRLGPRAGRGRPRRATPGQRAGPATRLGAGDDPRRGLGLGRAVAALRRAALRRPVRAGDPLRPRRLPGLADRRRAMGARRRGAAARPGLRRALPAARPRAAPGETFACAPLAATLEAIARDPRRRVLPRRARRTRWSTTRAPTARCTRSTTSPRTRVDWVDAARARLERRARPRDAAERPGHRRADGARHPRALRPRRAAGPTRPRASTCRSRR